MMCDGPSKGEGAMCMQTKQTFGSDRDHVTRAVSIACLGNLHDTYSQVIIQLAKTAGERRNNGRHSMNVVSVDRVTH